MLTPQQTVRAIGLLLLIAPGSLRSAYPVQGTFLNFYRNLTPQLWGLEFQYMQAVNINTVVVVSVGHLEPSSGQALSCTLGASGSFTDSSGYELASDGLLYPSAFAHSATRPTTDLLETVFNLADAGGMSVYLGSLQTASEWSDGTEFCALGEYNRQIASEIAARYGHHSSFKGWYFTQEVWMNWVKYYGQQANNQASGYYGTSLMAQWAADMKAIDATKLTSAAVVVKEAGTGLMPSLTAPELQQWTTGLLESVNLDILMPQDGTGAQAGAPALSDLPEYFSALSAAIPAAGKGTSLWSTIEMFSASTDASVSGEQYAPAKDISRIHAQVNAVRPFVSGYISWMFGDDLSPQATYFPVEADALNRKYRSVFGPFAEQQDDLVPIQSYWYPGQQPDSSYADSVLVPKLSDGTGGGYPGQSLSTWVGFSNPQPSGGSVQVEADLGSVQVIHSARALTQSAGASGILHPSQLTVEVSTDGVTWIPFGSTSQFPDDSQSFAVMLGEVGGKASVLFVRWTFSYTKWLFLAELEVLGPQ